MATIYVPDELMAKVISSGYDKRKFAKKAIEEKLDREGEI